MVETLIVAAVALGAVALAVYLSRSGYANEDEHLKKVQSKRRNAEERALRWQAERRAEGEQLQRRVDRREAAQARRYKDQAKAFDADQAQRRQSHKHN